MMMKEHLPITIRPYRAGDFDSIIRFWTDRGERPPVPSVLPPCGFVAELDGEVVGCIFATMAINIGFAHVEYVGLRVGFSLGEATFVVGHLLGTMKDALAALDYGAMIAHVHPAIARYLARNGFTAFDSGLTALVCPTMGRAA
jgi:hypothetical protein